MSLPRKIGIGLVVLIAFGFLAPNGWYVLGAIVIVLVIAAFVAFEAMSESHDSRRRYEGRRFRPGRGGDGRWTLPDEDRGPRP
ncbi:MULTISPECIES: hypothetical protein [unclassified Streptomyces]|uniref:hypothetical protein n=1 Tax=unclassified Streptomyces TaxID=2593676 RepID=UPI0006F8603C|nr:MULTISPECIES: hypothetical protein [unclassified Streptomyces]KQX49850.1 hypothetical protein ASD33_14440 [Streptomyces sp. Root1304]KRA80107.1 hypothetical protein ASE09_18470 [Streptomyces sp. Root66D1]